MTKVTKKIKSFTYVGWLKKMTKLKEQGYTYDQIYKDWMGRRCAVMYKFVENG